MEPQRFTKLSLLINDTFTIQKFVRLSYKMWDIGNKKMVTSDVPLQGYRKTYSFDTDKGRLDLGPGQVGTLLEAVFSSGEANLIDRTFSVKSNGKTGMEIRYYFDPVDGDEPMPIDEPPQEDLGF